MPSCFLCNLTFKFNSHLIKHLNIFHDHKSIDVFKCSELKCFRIFNTFHSFKNHLKQHKNFQTLKHTESHQSYNSPFIINPQNTPSFDSFSLVENKVSPTNSNLESITINNFIETLQSNTVLLASKWYNDNIIPRKIIQTLFDDIQLFNNSFLSDLKTKIFEIIKLNQIDIDQTKDLLMMFDKLSNTFSNVKSEHLRFKTFDDMGILIRPRMIDIGYRLNDKLRNGRVMFEPNAVTMAFVPLRSVLKLVLQDCGMFHVILEYMNHLESISSENNCISNFVQSQLWHSKLLKNPEKILLPLFLFFDDFEINNALGSHAGNNKLGAVYVSMPCLPPELSSSIENIFLVQLFKSSDRQEFGNELIFAELISELNFLEDVGIDILYNGEIYRVCFSLGLILGDNLGLHSILGFTESFISRFPCRFCKLHKLMCHNQVKQVDGELRNESNYDEDIAINNLTVTGIKEKCVFNKLKSFHVTQNFAVDIMHDILEGVCKYDIGAMLKKMIFDLNYFTIETLNNRIESFNYGTIDIRNRPPLVSSALIKNSIIKMSASEMLCFTKYLGLIIGDLVPLNSEIWNLYINLRQIIGILLDKSFKYDDLNLCSTLITEHHELYMKLFNTNLKPKFHHMVHYPMIINKCGPLSLIWSMRFESKHKQLKDTAKSITSRKNACYTLALKHQLNLAYRILSTKNKVIDTTKLGRYILINASKLTEYNNSEFLTNKFNFLTDNISFVSWIDFKGTMYNCNNMAVLLRLSDDPNILPMYGLILSLFIAHNIDNKPFVICNIFNCNYFNEHFQAYNVTLTNKLMCCSIENLDSVKPNTYCITSTNLCFIPK